MISSQGLTKRFGTQLAADQLSLEVPPGIIVGLLGPNGAGKMGTTHWLMTRYMHGKPLLVSSE